MQAQPAEAVLTRAASWSALARLGYIASSVLGDRCASFVRSYRVATDSTLELRGCSGLKSKNSPRQKGSRYHAQCDADTNHCYAPAQNEFVRPGRRRALVAARAPGVRMSGVKAGDKDRLSASAINIPHPAIKPSCDSP